MLAVAEMAVFGLFLAQRAIVCSHGRQPVEKIGPITPEPPQGAAEQFEDEDDDEDEDESRCRTPTNNHISLSHPGHSSIAGKVAPSRGICISELFSKTNFCSLIRYVIRSLRAVLPSCVNSGSSSFDPVRTTFPSMRL